MGFDGITEDTGARSGLIWTIGPSGELGIGVASLAGVGHKDIDTGY